MTDCDQVRTHIGGYVLGGLTVDERRDVEHHLGRCPTCSSEHASLAVLPALLDLTVGPAPRAPDRLRDRVIAEAARRHSARRWAAASVAAALVAALAGVAVGTTFAPSRSPAPTPAVAIELDSVAPFDQASGWATLHTVTDGIVVSLEVTDLEPLPDPQIYEAWLYTTDRAIVSIGQLTLDGDRVETELSASGTLDDYRGLWITAEPDGRDPAHEGPTVLRAPLPPSP